MTTNTLSGSSTTASQTYEVGQKLELVGEVGPRMYAEIWAWAFTVKAQTAKALKLGAYNTDRPHLYVWIPKSCIKDGELTWRGVQIIRESYIARDSCGGVMINSHGILMQDVEAARAAE